MKYILITGIFCVAVAYLAGVDAAMDAKAKAQRDAAYCKLPGHSETYCAGKGK